MRLIELELCSLFPWVSDCEVDVVKGGGVYGCAA